VFALIGAQAEIEQAVDVKAWWRRRELHPRPQTIEFQSLRA